MKSAGAAIIGALAVAGAVALASKSANAASSDSGGDVDLDVDSELQLAGNYYAMAITHPETWSAGQLLTLEGFLQDLGLNDEAANVHDMRVGIYGDAIPNPEALPQVRFIPQSEIDAIANAVESEVVV